MKRRSLMVNVFVAKMEEIDVFGGLQNPMLKEMRGKNIILREQKMEDVPFFTYWYNQPQVMFECGFTEPTDEETEKERIRTAHEKKDAVWYTITDLAGNLIGETGLLRMFPAWHRVDLSIIIPDPKMQHRGFGTEAINLMLNLAFDYYQMNRVGIGVVGLNTEALRFYTKIGFKQEGIEEQGYCYDNQYCDFIMMRILRHEWQ